MTMYMFFIKLVAKSAKIKQQVPIIIIPIEYNGEIWLHGMMGFMIQ